MLLLLIYNDVLLSSSDTSTTDATKASTRSDGDGDDERARLESVHVALAGDRAQWRAMMTVVNSTVTNAADASRLRFHVFCTHDERAALQRYIDDVVAPHVRPSLALVEFDVETSELRRFSRASTSNRFVPVRAMCAHC